MACMCQGEVGSFTGTFTHVESMEGKQTSKHLQKVPSGNLTWLLKMAIYSGFTH